MKGGNKVMLKMLYTPNNNAYRVDKTFFAGSSGRGSLRPGDSKIQNTNNTQ